LLEPASVLVFESVLVWRQACAGQRLPQRDPRAATHAGLPPAGLEHQHALGLARRSDHGPGEWASLVHPAVTA